MKKRPGFYLVEMIVVMAILPVVLIVTAQLFRTFAQEMPRSRRLVGEHAVLLHLLGQLQTDLRVGRQVRVEGQERENPPLIIEGRDGTWTYRISAQGVERSRSAADPHTRKCEARHLLSSL